MRKICILGTADTIYRIPYDTHEIWAVGTCSKIKDIERIDRIFEIHHRECVEKLIASGHLYNQFKCPVYVRDVNEMQGIFNDCRNFPGKEIIELFENDYFTSSMSWMIAWAILEGADEIAIVGVHLHSSNEYKHERPCVEYWISKAQEKEIKVIIPKDSSILHKYFVYGYDKPPINWQQVASQKKLTERMIKEAIAGYNKALVTSTQLQTMKGVIDDIYKSCVTELTRGSIKTVNVNEDKLEEIKNKVYNRQVFLKELNEEMLRNKEIFDRFFGANLALDLYEDIR